MALIVLAFLPTTRDHLRAVAVLEQLSDPNAVPLLRKVVDYPVDETETTFATPSGPVRARLYTPRGVAHPPGMLLVPGVHRLGIDDPRMLAFARSLAATGIVVLTPSIQELADYRVVPGSIATIGSAAQDLSRRLAGPVKAGDRPVFPRVGVLGLSFAGGLSLLAAADPQYSNSIAFVFCVGAHDDLARVARFFSTDEMTWPDGHITRLRAHEYGVLILVYEHTEDFFAPADAAPARASLRLWLEEHPELARQAEKPLSPLGQKILERLYTHDDTAVADAILHEVETRRAEMDAVSPHGKLAQLSVPVFLLHGTGDDIIPAAETAWLAREVPASQLRAELISPAISHIELEGKPTLLDQWRVVHFMAGVLREARRTD